MADREIQSRTPPQFYITITFTTTPESHLITLWRNSSANQYKLIVELQNEPMTLENALLQAILELLANITLLQACWAL